jgi:hypothetical protein
MPTFLPGSIHELKVQLKLPDDYEKDEDNISIGFWLVNVKGKRFDIMGESPSIQWEGGETVRLFPVLHLTKTYHEFTFKTTMPKKQGEYKLTSNISSWVSASTLNQILAVSSITIKK